jgi:hypothetical protein
MEMGDGWKWLRTVAIGVFGISRIELFYSRQKISQRKGTGKAEYISFLL